MKKFFCSIAIVAPLLLFASPALAASTHNYVCGDFTLDSGTSCTDSPFTFTTSSASNSYSTASNSYSITSGTTYYISFQVPTLTAGTFHTLSILSLNSGSPVQTIKSVTSSGNVVDFSFLATGNADGLEIHGQVSGTGILKNLCITDTSGACEGGGGGGGGAALGFTMLSASSTNNFASVIGAVTSSEVDSVILWTFIAISLPLAFYVILEVIEWFSRPEDLRRRRRR